MVKSSSRPDSSAARSATSKACSGVAHARCGSRSSLRPVRRPRLRGRSAGLYGISGGLVAAASPRMVPSRVRAARAVRAEIPVLAGRVFSHLVIPSVLSEFSSLAPPGRADEPPDQVLAIVLRADADILDSQPSVDPFADRGLSCVRVGPAALPDPGFLVASPGERGSFGLEAGLAGFPPPGSLYLTRQACGPFPRFSA